jgi:hypothetical protein
MKAGITHPSTSCGYALRQSNKFSLWLSNSLSNQLDPSPFAQTTPKIARTARSLCIYRSTSSAWLWVAVGAVSAACTVRAGRYLPLCTVSRRRNERTTTQSRRRGDRTGRQQLQTGGAPQVGACLRGGRQCGTHAQQQRAECPLSRIIGSQWFADRSRHGTLTHKISTCTCPTSPIHAPCCTKSVAAGT